MKTRWWLMVILGGIMTQGCTSQFDDDLTGTGSTTTTITVPLVAPTGVGGAIQTGTDILFTWNDTNTVEEGYRVEVGDSSPIPKVNPTAWAILPANTTSWLFSGGAANTTYYFQVYAVHVTQNLESPASVEFNITTPNVLPGTTVFSSLTGPTQITLTWLDLAAELSYTVQRSTDGGMNWTDHATGIPANTTMFVDNVAEDTEYCYRVLGVNASGPGAPSNVVCELSQTITGISATTLTGLTGSPSIAVESGGTEHIAHLQSGAGFDVDIVRTLFIPPSGPPSTIQADGGPTGAEELGTIGGTSIDLDAASSSHFAHFDNTNNSLRYASNSTGPMVGVTLDAGGAGVSNGELAEVKVSPLNGTIHVVYKRVMFGVNPFQGILRHAWNSGAGWSFEDIYSTAVNDRIEGLSMDVDDAGTVHVGFYEITNGNSVFTIRYTQKPAAGAWSAPVTASITSGLRDFSLAADGSGFAHIALESMGLRHGTNASGSWVFTAVITDPVKSFGWSNSVTINRTTGRIHIVHRDNSTDHLRYARQDPAGPWVEKLLDLDADGPTGVDLDGAGNPHIVFRDATTAEIERLSGAP